MKKCSIIVLILLTGLFISCEKRPPVSPGEIKDDQFIVAEETYYELIGDCLRALKITDVFNSYQTIKEDRTVAQEFVKQYFYPVHLYYDSMTCTNGWEVSLNPVDRCYYSCFTHSKQCMYLNVNTRFKAAETGEHSWHFDAVPASEKFSFARYGYAVSFDGSVTDDILKVENYDMTYSDYDSNTSNVAYTLHAYTPDGLSMESPMDVGQGRHKYYPSSGTLVIEYRRSKTYLGVLFNGYSLEPASMTLTLTFHGDMFRIEDGKGYSKEFEAKTNTFHREEF